VALGRTNKYFSDTTKTKKRLWTIRDLDGFYKKTKYVIIQRRQCKIIFRRQTYLEAGTWSKTTIVKKKINVPTAYYKLRVKWKM